VGAWFGFLFRTQPTPQAAQVLAVLLSVALLLIQDSQSLQLCTNNPHQNRMNQFQAPAQVLAVLRLGQTIQAVAHTASQ
jgi:hypothetical protein